MTRIYAYVVLQNYKQCNDVLRYYHKLNEVAYLSGNCDVVDVL